MGQQTCAGDYAHSAVAFNVVVRMRHGAATLCIFCSRSRLAGLCPSPQYPLASFLLSKCSQYEYCITIKFFLCVIHPLNIIFLLLLLLLFAACILMYEFAILRLFAFLGK